MRVPNSMGRLLSGKKLMRIRGKCTTLLTDYQELLVVALKGPREDQSSTLIMSKKDEEEAAEVDSGS